MAKDVQASRRAVVYCIVPEDLADKLHGPLRAHYADDPKVDVVVEQRWRARRGAPLRRTARAAELPPAEERRRIRAVDGRRVADRRASAVPVDPPAGGLPRKAAAHAQRLVFVEVSEPSTQVLEDVDTARVVTRIQAGDDAAYVGVYMRYFDRVYGFVHTILRDGHAAEDVTQQVFLEVLRALPRYERRSQPFRAWLFIIARNQALMRAQKDRKLEFLDSEALDRHVEAGEPQESEFPLLGWISDRELYLFIERLPAVQHQVLMLRYAAGLETAEIAEILGESPDAVRKQQQRALAFLRQRLTAVGRTPHRGDLVGTRTLRRPARVVRLRRFALTPR